VEECRRFVRAIVSANLESSQATSFGILEMRLHPNSYHVRFVPAAGGRSFSDSGHAECH
jgi:hypothetical protein